MARNPSSNTRRRRPYKLTRNKLLKAIRGSGGILSEIARRCGVHTSTVTDALRRKGWEAVEALRLAELESTADLAEAVIIETFERREANPALASQNARWFLSRKARDRGYGDARAIGTERSDTPAGAGTPPELVPIECLSLETRRKILEELEAAGTHNKHNDETAR